MQDFSVLKKQFESMKKAEKDLLPYNSIQQSAKALNELYNTFLPQLKETDVLYLPEREAHQIEFQNRLSKIAKWQSAQ